MLEIKRYLSIDKSFDNFCFSTISYKSPNLADQERNTNTMTRYSNFMRVRLFRRGSEELMERNRILKDSVPIEVCRFEICSNIIKTYWEQYKHNETFICMTNKYYYMMQVAPLDL